MWHGIACRIHEVFGTKVILARDDCDDRRVADVAELSNAMSLGQVELRTGGTSGYAEQVVPFGMAVVGHSKNSTRRLLQLSDWLRELDGIGLHKIIPNNLAHQKAIDNIRVKHNLVAKDDDKLVECSIWTLYRAQKKVIGAQGGLLKLLPQYHLRGRYGSEVIDLETGEVVRVPIPRMNPVVADSLLDAIAAQEGDANSKLRIGDVAKDLRKRLEVANLHLPSREQLVMPVPSTIAKWVKRTIPAQDLATRRNGKNATRKAYRSNRARVAAERILQVVQFDDVDARVFLIDEDTGEPWGTAMFTFGVDERSQCLMGVNAGPEYRNVGSAISTVIHAMRRKDMGDPMLQSCTREWVQCGQFGLALLDNASYNAASDFKLAMMEMGVDFAYSKPKEPTNKSKVEGFNRTFKHQFAAGLPGSSVKKNDRDNLNSAMRAATHTLDSFLKKAMHWIIDEYSHTRGEDGLSPMERWQEQVDGLDLRPPFMARPEFAEFILPSVLKFRASGGLERNGLRYQNDRLDQIRRMQGNMTSVRLRVNPRNLETIFVADPYDEVWFTVPCVEDPLYVRGLTEQQHQLTKHFAAQAKKQVRPTTRQMTVARDDMRLQAMKGQTSRQLSVRGQAFLVKHAFRNLPALNPPVLASIARGGSPTMVSEDQQAIERAPESIQKAPKPTRLSLLEGAFSGFGDGEI